MKCPNCGAENDAGAGRCSSCGSSLSRNSGVPEAAKAVTTTGLMIGKKARLARMSEVVDPKAIISDRAYNATIVVVLLWGLLVNYLLCRFVGTAIFTLNPIVLLVGYLVLVIAGILISAKSHNPLISFLGYNMVVVPFGLIIALMVETYGGLSSNVVTQAFLYTLRISTAMMACGMIAPNRPADPRREAGLDRLDCGGDLHPVHRLRHSPVPAVSQDAGQRGGFRPGYLYGYRQSLYPDPVDHGQAQRLIQT